MSFPSQGYIPSTFPDYRLKDQVNNLVLVADQEWFSSDIVPTPADGVGSEIIILFCFSAKAEIQISFDSGTTWCALNNKFKPEAETTNTFVAIGINTDTINFRADMAGTLRYARVFERGGEN